MVIASHTPYGLENRAVWDERPISSRPVVVLERRGVEKKHWTHWTRWEKGKETRIMILCWFGWRSMGRCFEKSAESCPYEEH